MGTASESAPAATGSVPSRAVEFVTRYRAAKTFGLNQTLYNWVRDGKITRRDDGLVSLNDVRSQVAAREAIRRAREARRRESAELYGEGLSTVRIAENLGIHFSTVNDDLRVLGVKLRAPGRQRTLPGAPPRPCAC